MRHPMLELVIALGLVLSAAAPAVARPQEDSSVYGLEEQLPALPTTAASRRLLTRRETERRTVEREIVERPSVNGGYETLFEVQDETVRIDSRTTRRTRRVLRPDPNGRQTLVQTMEEHREEGPDGRVRMVRTTAQPDVNGRPHTTRRDVMTTLPEGGGIYRTEIETSVRDVNGSGLVAVERIQQNERRDGEKLLELEQTTYRRPIGSSHWKATERRSTHREHGDREVRTAEGVYRLDGNDKLSLVDRIITREWTDVRGAEHVTQEVHTTDIPFLARSSAPGLYRKIEMVRTRRPDGSLQATREVSERGMNGFRLIERVVEESRPTPDGAATVRTVQRPDGNGRLRTVSVSRSNETGS